MREGSANPVVCEPREPLVRRGDAPLGGGARISSCNCVKASCRATQKKTSLTKYRPHELQQSQEPGVAQPVEVLLEHVIVRGDLIGRSR